MPNSHLAIKCMDLESVSITHYLVCSGTASFGKDTAIIPISWKIPPKVIIISLYPLYKGAWNKFTKQNLWTNCEKFIAIQWWNRKLYSRNFGKEVKICVPTCIFASPVTFKPNTWSISMPTPNITGQSLILVEMLIQSHGQYYSASSLK